jgi:hypothetical protein
MALSETLPPHRSLHSHVAHVGELERRSGCGRRPSRQTTPLPCTPSPPRLHPHPRLLFRWRRRAGRTPRAPRRATRGHDARRGTTDDEREEFARTAVPGPTGRSRRRRRGGRRAALPRRPCPGR